jgi:DNA primase
MDSELYVTDCQKALQESEGWWARGWLEKRGLTPRTIGLYRLGYDPVKKAVVIPYFNALEEVRSFRYRMLEGNIKYMTPKGEHVHLFHVRASRKPQVWLCEGEFDAMILAQMGLPSVGIAGVNSFKSEWKYLFAYCERLTLVMDGDEAGREASARLAGILGTTVDHLRIVRLPVGKDVTDLYLENRQQLEGLVR